MGMPVSAWMIEQLWLQPGQRVLELAAGPGDTGFLAAELIRPGGTLISSDAAEAMLEVARERARGAGDRRTSSSGSSSSSGSTCRRRASTRSLCRWGVMLSLDPAAAMHETRRVLRPGGRIALAVWDDARGEPVGDDPDARR